jgi:hypothetical protein
MATVRATLERVELTYRGGGAMTFGSAVRCAPGVVPVYANAVTPTTR